MRRAVPLILAVGVAAAGAASAQAATQCVGAPPGCTGVNHATFASAVTAANADTDPVVRIELGAGAFSVTGALPLLNSGSRRLEVVGQGAAATTVERTTAGDLLKLASGDDGSLLSDLSVRHAGPSGMALQAQGVDLERAVVSASGSGEAANVTSASVRASQISQTGSATALRLYSSDLLDSNVTGKVFFAVGATGTSAIRRSSVTVEAGSNAVYVNGQATVESSVLRGGSLGVLASLASSGVDTSVTARHLTILTSGAAPGAAAESYVAGRTGALDLRDSVILGGTVAACGGTGNAAATATLVADHLATTGSIGLCAADSNIGAETVTPPATLVTAPPLLVDQAGGDLRPTAASPLVDAGTPGPLGAGESVLDRSALSRLTDGNADGTARRDLGAYEYQPPAPSPVPGAPAAGGPPAGSGPVPVIGALRIVPARFRPLRSGPSLSPARRGGALLTVRLTTPATVTFRVQRRIGSRWLTLQGTFARRLRAGITRLRFSGRLRARALRPGSHRLRAVATADGRRSAPRTASFRILD